MAELGDWDGGRRLLQRLNWGRRAEVEAWAELWERRYSRRQTDLLSTGELLLPLSGVEEGNGRT